MCGITGAYAFNEKGREFHSQLDAAIATMAQRGPDGNGRYLEKSAALGHARLAILDTSSSANQPFSDTSGRYTIIFNGEIYNFKEIAEQLTNVELRTSSDTEVLLYGFIQWGEKVLDKKISTKNFCNCHR